MSNKMSSQATPSISQIKNHLQTIINNIKTLEILKAQNNEIEKIQLTDELQAQIVQTDQLLTDLETIPLKNVPRTIQKRHRKRKNKKTQAKRIVKISNRQVVKEKILSLSKIESKAVEVISPPTREAHSKPHQTLLNAYNAQRYLRIFELLKILHTKRAMHSEVAAESDAFAAKLQNLIVVWNEILQENTVREHAAAEHRLEDQWEQVLFGAPQKSYYVKDLKMKEFLKIRHIWDTYITTSGNQHGGSSIPLGWVYPSENALPSWQEYLVS